MKHKFTKSNVLTLNMRLHNNASPLDPTKHQLDLPVDLGTCVGLERVGASPN